MGNIFDLIRNKETAAIREALASGEVDLTERNQLLQTPLIAAVEAGDHQTVTLILEATKNELYYQSLLGGTALSLALYLGHSDIAKLLINAENPFQPDKHPDLWFCAVGSDSIECVKILLNSELPLNKPCVGTWRSHPDNTVALENDTSEEGRFYPYTVELAITDRFNRLPILYAAANNSLEMVRYCIEQGADLLATDKNETILLTLLFDEIHPENKELREFILVQAYQQCLAASNKVTTSTSVTNSATQQFWTPVTSAHAKEKVIQLIERQKAEAGALKEIIDSSEFKEMQLRSRTQ